MNVGKVFAALHYASIGTFGPRKRNLALPFHIVLIDFSVVLLVLTLIKSRLLRSRATLKMLRNVSSDREREGIALDVRKDDPYAAYDEIPFNVVSYNEGGTWARLMVRADEILESLDILDYAFNHIPGGRLRVRVQRKVPEGEAVSRVEAPRGELIHYVKSDGTAYP